ncbi:MAG TPA: hypothetical protein H9755_07210 [Candidatus Dietzia intestinigallinarum]|nr:hypothetical protein [Candidatus Dietzia intestinigallinarum]
MLVDALLVDALLVDALLVNALLVYALLVSALFVYARGRVVAPREAAAHTAGPRPLDEGAGPG